MFIIVVMNNNNWLNVTGAAEKVAKIKIHGVIGGSFFEEGVTAEQVEADLEAIASIKAETIIVDLDSLGGSVQHGMKIHTLLKSNPAKIKVNITGWTASMGTVIAMAADEGELSIIENNHFLVHEARTFSMGTQSQLEADAKFLKNINKDIASIYSERTGLSQDDALNLMAFNGGEGEFWNSDETLEKGFVDSIFKVSELNAAVASVSKEQLNEFKINAKINTKMDNKEIEVEAVEAIVENEKSFDLGEVTNKIIESVKDAITPVESKVEEKEEIIVEETVTNEVVVEDMTAKMDLKEAELTAKSNELADLQAKYDVLNAGSTEPIGADANVGGEANLTEADKAAKDLVASLSDSDRVLFSAVSKKK